ncbi:LysR substrate-binding domain-containing protein [Pelagibius sp. Alg239-R121]|uniref:LysR substrate-binding domain-containing protein n=1 Tax=Pelagibius sp. Alg239-R121 TaxID=2993448 RepID=UPI0024A75988|nr:LysR substrate-binding domain-containing protein [Pelagibius sp. Alg239-R121]
MNSDLLRSFLAVAEIGNVTHAAAAIGRTQSAVSLQIQKLEGVFSVQLFERGSRGVLLTDEGQRLLPAARKALAEIDRVGALFSDPLAGRIRVGIPDDYNETILEKALARFAARYNDVEVFVRSGCTAGFPNAIKRGELDLAIFSAGPNDPEKTFFSEPTVWAAGAEMLLDRNVAVPLALFDRDCWWRDVATSALDQAGRSWRLAYQSENYTSVKAAISAGLAVGILARSAVEDSMQILGEPEGFPPLPPTSLSLLKGPNAAIRVVQEMEKALRSAIL